MTEKKKETEAAMDELDFEDEDTEHETASASQKDCCCCKKTKERSEQEYKDLIHRLNRIEGQIRGIRGMVERDAYCTDILTQVSAVSAALNSFNKVLLANHIKTCVMRDIKEGKEETVDELVATLQKLMK
jgi:DNA-binding FrmR family transcriptional regulator